MRRSLKSAVVCLSLAASLSSAQTPPETFETKYCSGCHAIDKKVVGPSMKDVALKHKDRTDAIEYLVGKIKKGGVGVWGQVPMPANENLADAEAKTLAEWIVKVK
jgi:cytochrome c